MKGRCIIGTRADFWVGRGKQAEWIGSIAMDGYPDGQPANPEYGGPVITSKTEQEFRDRVAKLIGGVKTGTTPEQGWPWPWKDSRTTDYAYAFDAGAVWASCFGHEWFDPNRERTEEEQESAEEQGKVAVFPNMEDEAKPTLGPSSGMIVAFMPR